MPSPASQADWEMTMVMPLGVLANQLGRIEGDLRFLSMKAAEHAAGDDPRSTKVVDARLDVIQEVLGSIESLLARLRADLHPKGPALPLPTRESGRYSAGKPSPERDD